VPLQQLTDIFLNITLSSLTKTHIQTPFSGKTWLAVLILNWSIVREFSEQVFYRSVVFHVARPTVLNHLNTQTHRSNGVSVYLHRRQVKLG